MNPKRCNYCKDEPEAGWIETPNNGPIVPCPVCNPKTQREIEYDRALMARAVKSCPPSTPRNEESGKQTFKPCEKYPDRYCNCEGFYPACRQAPASTASSPK